MARIEPFEQHFLDYENWFERNEFAYASELSAVRELFPEGVKGLEVGVGTGRFAGPLGIQHGIEPSGQMAAQARKRGIDVRTGVAEDLPFAEGSYNVVLMVTTICFVDDIEQAFREAFRVLEPGGAVVVGFVDKNSRVGQRYLEHKDESIFYRSATFFSTEEVVSYLEKVGFVEFEFAQTIFNDLDQIHSSEPVRKGYGEGSFVVVRALKPPE